MPFDVDVSFWHSYCTVNDEMRFRDLSEGTIRLILVAGFIASALFVIGLASLVRQVLFPPPCVSDPAKLPPPPADSYGGRPNYLHTCGNRIYDSLGHEARLTGINWFGMETGTYVPHGLWSRNYKAVLDQIAQLGYNSIRLPYSNEALDPGRKPQGINYQANPDLQGLTSIEVMDKIIAAARQRHLKIILDRHRPNSQAQSSLWYTEDVSEERWIEDWKMLALRYLGDDTVIGVDLHNEPKDEATWGTGDIATDWSLAAQRAGDAILETNPYLLIFVQGIDHFGSDYYWWGGNLQGVAKHPVKLNIPNRVVYSPHDYGPEVFPQGWFFDPTFPSNLPKVWDKYWGYIHKNRFAPIVLGEFGGRSVGSDAEGQWQQALLNYLHQNRIGFINWTLNPNSSDTGGLLSDDWLTVVEEKQDLYRRYLAPPIGSANVPTHPSNAIKLTYHPSRQEYTANNIGIHLQIINEGATPIAYSRLEIRYWFSAGQLRGRSQELNVDFAPMGESRVKGKFVPVNVGGQDNYLSITFDDKAGMLQPYGSSGEIMMRVHKSDWSNYDQSNDYSYGSFEDFQEWDRIALYLDGNLVWGTQP
ncbi:MAG: cellulase family glycosylhydrolase [Chloroflexi bacterium]|nr:cellulase family glycosylhydrolase [Chloroflexota bacterium]